MLTYKYAQTIYNVFKCSKLYFKIENLFNYQSSYMM